MKADTARHRNMQHSPDEYGFDEKALRELHGLIGKAIASEDTTGARAALVCRLGRNPDGTACLWHDVRSGGESVGVVNNSWNCPPRPLEECEE